MSIRVSLCALSAGLILLACSSTSESPALDPEVSLAATDHGASSEDTTSIADLGTPPDLFAPGDGAGETGTTPLPDVPVLQDLTQDTGCGPGTQCYQDNYIIMGSKLTVIVGGTELNPAWYFLDVFPPASVSPAVVVRSTGFNQIFLVDAFFEKGGNPNITFSWSDPNLPSTFPLTLMPGEEVTGTLTYAPVGDPVPVSSTLTLWSSDPDMPVRQVVFFPKQSGPDIELPFSAVNYGCGSYCNGRDFVIENAGNQNLVIQSTQFQIPSAEWTVTGAPQAGTTLVPKGGPGYAPIQFTIDYCDADGNLLDDNKFEIYSNDPDESPALIDLHVIQPYECP